MTYPAKPGSQHPEAPPRRSLNLSQAMARPITAEDRKPLPPAPLVGRHTAPVVPRPQEPPASRSPESIGDDVLRLLDVTGAQARILRACLATPGITAEGLMADADVQKGTLTPCVMALARRGFLHVELRPATGPAKKGRSAMVRSHRVDRAALKDALIALDRQVAAAHASLDA